MSDGRIVAVGSRAEIETWIGPGTQTLDVDGCVMRSDSTIASISGWPCASTNPGSDAACRARPAQSRGAAYQLFSDNVIGSLEVGKYADMVVLSADPRAVPPEEIADLEVQATFLAGRQVYTIQD